MTDLKPGQRAQKLHILQRQHDQKQYVLLARGNTVNQYYYIYPTLNQTTFPCQQSHKHTCILISRIHTVFLDCSTGKPDHFLFVTNKSYMQA